MPSVADPTLIAPALTASAIRNLFETLTLVALLSVAYGTVMRHARRPVTGHALVGLMFGGGAMIAMDRTVTLGSGLLLDLCSLPLVLAGAFLGGPGAATAMALAAVARGVGGGDGLPADLAGILLAGGLGLLWARMEGPGPRRLPALLRLAAVSTATLLATLLLPPHLVVGAVVGVWPVLLPLLWVGVAASGALLERERRFLAHVGRLSREGEEDALTGLLNRRGFVRAVEHARARAERRGADAAILGRAHGPAGLGRGGEAVVLIDIDHFKRINDRHGHLVGDAVLQAIGPRLRMVLRPGDIVARIGGEEIAVFLSDTTAHAAERVARRICDVVRDDGFAVPDGPVVALTASVGGAWAGRGRTALEALLARADAALYEAKGAGRDRSRFVPADEGDDPAARSADGEAEAPWWATDAASWPAGPEGDPRPAWATAA